MAQADNNVPQIGPRSFYNLVGMNPTLLLHKGTINGLLPAVAPDGPELLDPVVSGGKAVWSGLSQGGLFPFTGKSLIVEGLVGVGPWSLVDSTDTVIRPMPIGFPFKLLPNERLKATGGTEAGVIVRLDAQRTL